MCTGKLHRGDFSRVYIWLLFAAGRRRRRLIARAVVVVSYWAIVPCVTHDVVARDVESYEGYLNLHNFYVRYKLPMKVEVQHFEYLQHG